ncbi:MAG: CRTAC1 family protein [Verrucomicrobiota bacterium]
MSRATIEGDLKVFWQEGQIDPIARIKAIDATQLSIRVRPGEPAFKLAIFEQLLPLRNSRSIDPLLVYDLNGDGLPEIILASRNVVYRRFPDGHYGSESLCRYPTDVVYVALIGDFDGDGVPDFLAEDYSGLQLFKGSRQGRFETPGRLVWRAGREIQYPMMLTAGDIDEDGDLDLFLAQYKLPYEGGQMPAPYYDANDGYPSFLLLNDGRGRWLDATERSGLSGKRWRRTYSASIADVDGDGHLDLVVVSDFAGVDCYRNNGKGRFEDVTRTWFPEPRVFGMALAMADFNQDAALDLLVTGMPSPTADRLEHLSLWRPDSHEDRQMRARVTKGNRLYMRQPTGQFEETSLAANLARSGWSWGCAAFDADNDGFPEIYVANGMESTQSVRDYEGQFWLHDIYVGGSTEDPVVNAYLRAKVARMRSQGESFGGHELNRFYWNDHGKQFLEAGHLFGLALEEDSRNVVATDVDGDGRLDIIVTSYAPWPSRFQNLRVYENRLTGTGNWIDFRFDDSSGETLSGLRITLSTSDGPRVGQIVFGDSYRSQHPSVIHFGLGIKERIDQAIIQWPSGRRTALERPAVNQHHLVSPPAR